MKTLLKNYFFTLLLTSLTGTMVVSASPKQTKKISNESTRKKEMKRLNDKFKDCCFSLTQHQISATDIISKGKPLHPDEKIVYIDVREDNEQKISMIPGAIKSSQIDFDHLDSKTKYVAYCTIGYRSGKFVEKLRSKGFNAYNLVGGIYGWTFEDGQLQDHSSKPTKRVHVYSDDWNYLRSDYQAEK
jgi:sodium/bile acid cotransporter 7